MQMVGLAHDHLGFAFPGELAEIDADREGAYTHLAQARAHRDHLSLAADAEIRRDKTQTLKKVAPVA